MVRKARAKINLTLDVTGKRADGYHRVRMVMQTVELCDVLTFTRIDTPGIALSCGRPDIPSGPKNLIWKAADLLLREFRPEGGIAIHLDKKIPSAAGLAGGSSDAAETMRAVNELFGLGLSERDLCERGVRIGADIPFCIVGGTALAEGIGEELTPLPAVPVLPLVLAKPGLDVPTGAVYRKLDALSSCGHPDVDGQIKAIRQGDREGIVHTLGNVLELVTAAEYPEIHELERFMRGQGAAGACMSGSGPTVFGIFENRECAENAAEKLRQSGFGGEVFVTETYPG